MTPGPRFTGTVLGALLLGGATHGHAAPSPLAPFDERARLLAPHLDWARDALAGIGRGKPDETGAWDLESLRIEVDLPADGAPTEARFLLEVVRTGPPGAPLSLLGIEWRPLAIVDAATGAGLDFTDAPEAFEVLVRTPEGADRLRLRIDATLEPFCGDPVRCQVRDAPRHLVRFGWYPASFDRPVDDRFLLTLSLAATTGEICASGAPIEGDPGRAAFAHPAVATLPAVLWSLDALLPMGGGPVRRRACTLAADGAAVVRMDAVAAAVLGHHAAILGRPPYAELALGEVANGTGAGLSPMGLVLMPSFVWTRNDAETDALRDALFAHEAAHQYFFAHIGITAPEDAWLSEGTAEYLSGRFVEARLGDDAPFRENYWGYVLGVAPEDDAPVGSTAAVESRAAFAILYQKGSLVWRRMERTVGRARLDAFLEGLVARFGGAILTTPELLIAAEAELGEGPANALAADLSSVGVMVLEPSVLAPRGPRGEGALRLAIRPGRATPEPVRIYLYGAGAEPDVVEVLPDNDAAPIALPAAVQWAVIDPERRTFRRVRPQPATDVNLSGIVDGMDFLDVLAAQGARGPSADWDDRLDVDADERIDERDLAAIADAFGTGL